MAKRHHDYTTGMSHNNRQGSMLQHRNASTRVQLSRITAMVAKYFWAGYATLNGNYVAVATVFLIVLLSFLLPDLSQKIHRTSELKTMKKMLHMMSKHVNQAEVACLTVADEICCLHCSIHAGAMETYKERRDLSKCTSGCIRTSQSEPMQVEQQNGFFNRIFFPKKNTSNKEIAIMSYLYTDSFDAANPIKKSKNLTEHENDDLRNVNNNEV